MKKISIITTILVSLIIISSVKSYQFVNCTDELWTHWEGACCGISTFCSDVYMYPKCSGGTTCIMYDAFALPNSNQFGGENSTCFPDCGGSGNRATLTFDFIPHYFNYGAPYGDLYVSICGQYMYWDGGFSSPSNFTGYTPMSCSMGGFGGGQSSVSCNITLPQSCDQTLPKNQFSIGGWGFDGFPIWASVQNIFLTCEGYEDWTGAVCYTEHETPTTTTTPISLESCNVREITMDSGMLVLFESLLGGTIDFILCIQPMYIFLFLAMIGLLIFWIVKGFARA